MITIEEAKEVLGYNIDGFCHELCTCYCKNEWYCPTECDVLEKARKVGFERICKSFVRNDEDMMKVIRFIKRAKV